MDVSPLLFKIMYPNEDKELSTRDSIMLLNLIWNSWAIFPLNPRKRIWLWVLWAGEPWGRYPDSTAQNKSMLGSPLLKGKRQRKCSYTQFFLWYTQRRKDSVKLFQAFSPCAQKRTSPPAFPAVFKSLPVKQVLGFRKCCWKSVPFDKKWATKAF